MVELKPVDDGEPMRRLLLPISQALIDAEATTPIGAAPQERTGTRTTQRNGGGEDGHDGSWRAPGADAKKILTRLVLHVAARAAAPDRRRPARGRDAGVRRGRSTRRVDDPVLAMGGNGISKSEVPCVCAGLHTDVAAWRSGPPDQPFPYVFVDALYPKARAGGRVVTLAMVIATGVSAEGRRDVLGRAVGNSGTEAVWTERAAIGRGGPPPSNAPARPPRRRRRTSGRDLSSTVHGLLERDVMIEQPKIVGIGGEGIRGE